MIYEDIFKKIERIKEISELNDFIDVLRVLSVNEKNDKVQSLIDRTLDSARVFNDKKSMVKLYDLKIRQLYSQLSNLSEIESILEEMKKILSEIDYLGGNALVNLLSWYIEKLKGNTKKSVEAIEEAQRIISQSKIESYVHYSCQYAYATEIWLRSHDPQSTKLLEECANFFYQEGYHRSLAQTFGLLSIIYIRKHEGKRALNISSVILANRALFEKLLVDVKGIIYYFTGLGYLLEANLAIAESYFNEAYSILKPIYKNSIYFANYLVLLSYLATVRSLQGKTEQAADIIKEADKLLQTEFIKKNLDENSKKQITHTHNLTKFYNISRLGNYNPQEHQVLICEIINNCKDLYSDFIVLSEFILSASLGSDKLQQLLEIDNFSINRVKHVIEFMLEKQKLETEISQEQKALNCIAILEKNVKTPKATFMENAYVDLLIAQQLFSLKRYVEIYPLLKQYENRLHRIEVLEMRIFIEAFIQVGAYKSGDPLGPALQYMAIKKCRDYGFSRLENKLLDYLQLQQTEITKTI